MNRIFFLYARNLLSMVSSVFFVSEVTFLSVLLPRNVCTVSLVSVSNLGFYNNKNNNNNNVIIEYNKQKYCISTCPTHVIKHLMIKFRIIKYIKFIQKTHALTRVYKISDQIVIYNSGSRLGNSLTRGLNQSKILETLKYTIVRLSTSLFVKHDQVLFNCKYLKI